MLQKKTYEKSWLLILAPVLLLVLFLPPSTAETVCDASLYGNPDPSDCSQILLDNRAKDTHGLESKDRKRHLFYTGHIGLRPSDVTLMEWLNRVDLAMTLSRGELDSEILRDGFELTVVQHRWVQCLLSAWV